MKSRIYFIFFLSSILITIYSIIFFPIFFSKNLIFTYSLHPFNLCSKPLWKLIKLLFFNSNIISSIIISNLIYTKKILSSKKNQESKITNSLINSDLNILIGYNEENMPIYLCEKSLYQNILITGTIGSGKTSSAIYPFTRTINSI